jgi:hypothetical protein
VEEDEYQEGETEMRASSLKRDIKLFIIKDLDEKSTLVQNYDGTGPEFTLIEDRELMKREDQVVVSSNRDDISQVFTFLPADKHNMKIVEVQASIGIYAAPRDLL